MAPAGRRASVSERRARVHATYASRRSSSSARSGSVASRDRAPTGEPVGEHDATWSHSRPLVPCAVARVRLASSRRSAASARRRRAIAGAQLRERRPDGRPAEHGGHEVGGRRAVRGSGGGRHRRRGRGGLRAQRPPQRPERRAAPAGPRVDRGRAARRSASSSIGSGRSGRTERDAEVERRDDGDQQLAVRPGEHGARRRVVGPASASPARTRTRSSAESGASTSRPVARGPGQDPLREPLRGCARRAGRRARRPAAGSGSSSRGRRAAARAARPRGRARAGRRPAASRRSTGRRRRRGRRRSPGPRAAARAPAGSGRGPAPRRPAGCAQRCAPASPARAGSADRCPSARTTRSSKSTPPSSAIAALVGDERAGDRARRRVARDLVGRHPEVELEPREGEVEPAAVRGAGLREQLAQQRVAVDERLDRDPRHPTSISRPRAWNVRTRTEPGRQPEWRQRRVQPRRQLLRRPLVERDDADGRGVRAAVHEPGHARDERRGLAAAGRRDAQHRPGWRRRRGALVRGQPAEPFGDRWMAGRLCHASILARTAYPPLIGPADRLGWLRNCKENANFTIR